jgi:uncharacterized protein YjbI with pentapeptide repeats
MTRQTYAIEHDRGVPRQTWTEQLPAASGALDGFPPCGEDGIDLRDLAVAGASFSLDEVAEKPELVNLLLRHCDVAGFVARDGRADRVLVDGGRLRGVTWTRGVLRDVELRDIEAGDFSLRFSTLRRVVFRDCVIPEIDLTEAVLDDVRFERCRLPGAQFHRAQVKSLRFEGCDLSGSSGVDALTGASIHPDDALSLATGMAAALGIRVEGGGDRPD